MSDTTVEHVGVVGLGYVGLPLALAMEAAGYRVTGVDLDPDRVDTLASGESYIDDVADEAVLSGLDGGFRPTGDYGDLGRVDGVSICVPTPLRKTNKPDLSFVIDAVERSSGVLEPDSTVILESTVYPGATEGVVAEAFAEAGFIVGEDLFLAFSPERIDPGNEAYGPTDIPKVIGGVTDACGDRATALYRPVFDEIVRVGSAREAELVKLLENTFRAVNIGMINEMAMIAHELDVDIWETIEAAATKPFGFMPFYPGPGLGGHCIPIDPFYLSYSAKNHGVDTRFIELADQVNREMPGHVVRRVSESLNDAGIPVPEADVLVVGVTYKPDVADVRESPAYDVIGRLDERNATVTYHDPFVPTFEVLGTAYESRPLTPEVLSSVDCVVIVTDHAGVDVGAIVESAPLVFDARNATAGIDADNVVRL